MICVAVASGGPLTWDCSSHDALKKRMFLKMSVKLFVLIQQLLPLLCDWLPGVMIPPANEAFR